MLEREKVAAEVERGLREKANGQALIAEITKEIEALYYNGQEFNCESPIEQTLYEAVKMNIGSFAMLVKSFHIVPQFEIGNYRLDFAIFADNLKIALECDGFDYHERTAEQATHDRQRDRVLTIAGYTVLRFTGKEIHENVDACVADILRTIRALTNKGA